MNKKLQAHSAIFFANTIFGLGVPVTKLLLDEWVTPMGYMASRSLGACILFWLIAAFMPKEHVERKDLITILFGGLLGFVISQTLTAWSLVARLYQPCLLLAHCLAHASSCDALCRSYYWREDNSYEITWSVAWHCWRYPYGADESVAWFWKERSYRHLPCHP